LRRGTNFPLGTDSHWEQNFPKGANLQRASILLKFVFAFLNQLTT
jgi:hypothetical protein